MSFTKLSNDLINRLVVCDLSARQIRILLFIIRQTIGYNRETYLMSRSFIAKGVQADVSNVRKDLAVLLEQNFIYEIRHDKDVKIGIIDRVENNPTNELDGVENNPTDRVENNPISGVKNNPQIKKVFKENNTNVQFEEFYMKYPRKQAKRDAEKAFNAALKKESFETIMQGLDGYVMKIQNEQTEMRFIKLPAGWLRDERWVDTLHIKPKESHIHRIIQANQHINGDADERLQRAFLERRKQAGLI